MVGFERGLCVHKEIVEENSCLVVVVAVVVVVAAKRGVVGIVVTWIEDAAEVTMGIVVGDSVVEASQGVYRPSLYEAML